MRDATQDATQDTSGVVDPMNSMKPTSARSAAGQPASSASMAGAEASGIARSMERPGLVTFAAILMFLLAGFQVTWALVQFSNAVWIRSVTYGSFGGYLWLWGILDLLYAAVLLYAGYDILRGGRTGQILGLIVVCLNAVRWFFYLPAVPWMAAVVIALDVLAIYALVAHSDYFESGVLNPAR